MSRKSPTQVELEKRVRDLEKELELLKRKYKRTLKQLSQFADQDLGVIATLEAEEESKFQKSTQKEDGPKKLEEEEHFTVTLPDGSEKRIKKRPIKE